MMSQNTTHTHTHTHSRENFFRHETHANHSVNRVDIYVSLLSCICTFLYYCCVNSAALQAFVAAMSSSSEFWGIIVSACLFFLILLTQPKLVGSAVSPSTYKKDTSHCSGKGNINSLTGLCDCFSDYRGADCSLRYCPYGPSWLSAPKYENERTRERVECSNMGTCDIFTGKCTCRPGYEGRACERSM
jgi:hypothetical protein